MGRSTVQELITRGMNMNDYNNTAIDSTGKWLDAFNAALQDLVEDINLSNTVTINFIPGTREYDLPDDFFEMQELNDNNFLMPVPRRQHYNISGGNWSNWIQGFWILNKGTNYVLDLFDYTSAQTFTALYTRYPVKLDITLTTSQKPEVPTIGEDALLYYAISRALRNNNQPGQAQDVERKYEFERRKIRDAAQRTSIGGW